MTKQRIQIIIEKKVKPYGIIIADNKYEESVFIPVIMFSELEQAMWSFKKVQHD